MLLLQCHSTTWFCELTRDFANSRVLRQFLRDVLANIFCGNIYSKCHKEGTRLVDVFSFSWSGCVCVHTFANGIFRFAKELLLRRQGVGARDNSIARLRAFCYCREVCANAEKASHSLILDDAILRELGASVRHYTKCFTITDHVSKMMLERINEYCTRRSTTNEVLAFAFLVVNAKTPELNFCASILLIAVAKLDCR